MVMLEHQNRALARFKQEPTMGNWSNYKIGRLGEVRELNPQSPSKSVWNRVRKIKGEESSDTIHHLSVNDIKVTAKHDMVNSLADISFYTIVDSSRSSNHTNQ